MTTRIDVVREQLVAAASEEYVLGSLLVDAATWAAARDLTPTHFARPAHSTIYAAIADRASAGREVDPVLVAESLQADGHLEEVGGLGYIGDLARNTTSTANILSHVEVLKEYAQRRCLADLGDLIARRARSAAAESVDQIAKEALESIRTLAPAAPHSIQALSLTTDDLLGTVEPERMLLPGIPTEAYSLIAGALSSYKSTLLIYLALWRATGFDLLDLDPGGSGVDIGPVMLVFYEDSDRRMVNRFRRITQAAHAQIRAVHGIADADRFIRCAAANIRRVPLTGQAGATIVRRAESTCVPNFGLIDELKRAAHTFTQSDLLLALDPLRLAIVGSQNDDDGADVVVHTLNHMATMMPNSGLAVASHTTKAEAREPAEGYTAAAYATSGSALYSQHARSNFLMFRLRPDAAAPFAPNLSPAELARQPIAKLIHGRLSHGAESGERVLQMKDGILVPLATRKEPDTASKMVEFGHIVAQALERLAASGVRASATALREDPEIRRYGGSDGKVRRLLSLLEENGYLVFEGKTKDRVGTLTPNGRAIFAATNHHETHQGGGRTHGAD